MEKTKKFDVEILSTMGSCKNEIFQKMAKKGDITAVKIDEVVGEIVTITGIAECNITTADNNFNINYFATKEQGFVSTGSTLFLDSVIDYLNDVDSFIIRKIKTKKGITYKAAPVLSTNEREDIS